MERELPTDSQRNDGVESEHSQSVRDVMWRITEEVREEIVQTIKRESKDKEEAK